MHSSYAFELKNGYLVMTITGVYDYWDFITYPEIVKEQCTSHNIKKVLIDVEPINHATISTLELFFLGERVAEVFRDRIKVAIFWRKNIQNGFLQTVANNRAAHMRIFNSKDDAKLWLLLNHDDEPISQLD